MKSIRIIIKVLLCISLIIAIGLVEKTFEGSLPAFIAAFTKHQKISDAEIDAVQQMIDRYRKGESK